MKIYRCEHCGNLFYVLNDSYVVPQCCGQGMLELEVNSTDGGIEKHVPIIHKDGKKVTVEVGIIAHPMVKEHYIEWIALKTDSGVQINYLQPGEKPEAKFTLTDETSTLVAYEYCNQHGLWKSKE